MDTTNVTVRMDKKLKEEADALFLSWGLPPMRRLTLWYGRLYVTEV